MLTGAELALALPLLLYFRLCLLLLLRASVNFHNDIQMFCAQA